MIYLPLTQTSHLLDGTPSANVQTEYIVKTIKGCMNKRNILVGS